MSGNPNFFGIKRLYVKDIDAELEQRLVDLSNGYSGTMSFWLQDAKRGKGDYVIYVAVDKVTRKVIGWTMVTNVACFAAFDGSTNNKIGTYVDPEYRRMGVGSRLVKAAKRTSKTFEFWNIGQGELFYNSIFPKNQAVSSYIAMV